MRSAENKLMLWHGGRKTARWRVLLGAVALFVLAIASGASGEMPAEGETAGESPWAPLDLELKEIVLKTNDAMLDKVGINENDAIYFMGYGPPLGTVELFYRIGPNSALNRVGTGPVHVRSEGWWEIRPSTPISVVGFENSEAFYFSLCWTPIGQPRECSNAVTNPASQLTMIGFDPEAHDTPDPGVRTWNLRAGVGNYPMIVRTFLLDGPDRTQDERTNDVEEAQANLWENPRNPAPSRVGFGFGQFCDQNNPLHLCYPDPSLTVSSYTAGMNVEFPFVLIGLLGHDIGRSVLDVRRFRRPEIPALPPLFNSVFFGYPLQVNLDGGCSMVPGGGSGVVAGALAATAAALALTLMRLRRSSRSSAVTSNRRRSG